MAKSTAKAKQTKKTTVTAKPKAKKSAPKVTAKKAATKNIAAKKTTSAKKVTKKAATPSKIESKKTESIVRQPVKALPESELPAQRLTKTYLTKEELKHFQQILLEKRAEVLRDLEIMRASLQDENNSEGINSSYSMHMADHGTETLDREQRFMFIARDERYLSYIDKALERIKNGVYGICAKSGLPIPKERLEAVPHTAVRIEYKNR
jgi:RNA polymerase-binding protein DksA